MIKLHHIFYRRIPGPQIQANNSKAKKQKRRLGQEDVEIIKNNGDNDNTIKLENADTSIILVDVTASDPFPFIEDVLSVD